MTDENVPAADFPVAHDDSDQPGKKMWQTPEVRRMRAGSAENAVAPVDDDGVNFS